MIASRSMPERQTGLVFTTGLALPGLTMPGAAKEGPMAMHGAMAPRARLFTHRIAVSRAMATNLATIAAANGHRRRS